MSNPLTVLRHVRPFDAASDKSLEQLALTASTRSFERAETIWRAGDSPTYFTVIQRGLIKIVRQMNNGRDAIVGLFGPRESIGEVAVVRGSPYPAAAIVCSEAATLIRIPRESFMAWLQSSADLAIRMTETLGDRVHTLHAQVDILSAGSVEARLASLLLDLGERFGDEFDDGSVFVPIALSRQELANLVSTSFETAIRVMSKWQKKDVLETRQDGFLLKDVSLLQTAASSVLGARDRQ